MRPPATKDSTRTTLALLLACGLVLTAAAACAPRAAANETAAASVPPEPVTAHSAEASNETVILLHGLGRSSRSMRKMAAALREHGYATVSLDYRSLSEPIEAHAQRLADVVDACRANDDTARIDLVGHSLGGIVIRRYLADRHPARLGRVVMLATPNGGSEIADLVRKHDLVARLIGPSAVALGTGSDGIVAALGPVTDVEVGVITGDRSVNPLFSWLIPGPDDGQVSIESAKLDGMRDFLVVPHAHTFLMNADDVIDQTIEFLQTGAFDHGPEAAGQTAGERLPIAASAGAR